MIVQKQKQLVSCFSHTKRRLHIHHFILDYYRSICVCILLLAIPNISPAAPATSATLDSLSWMVGAWRGALGPQTVEESWSIPHKGSMETMIRLSSPGGVQMIELIVIREVTDSEGKPSLMLHLRQFSPALEERTNQDMRLGHITEHQVSFVADGNASVPKLSYELLGAGHMKVQVTIVTGDVVTAELYSKH